MRNEIKGGEEREINQKGGERKGERVEEEVGERRKSGKVREELGYMTKEVEKECM